MKYLTIILTALTVVACEPEDEPDKPDAGCMHQVGLPCECPFDSARPGYLVCPPDGVVKCEGCVGKCLPGKDYTVRCDGGDYFSYTCDEDGEALTCASMFPDYGLRQYDSGTSMDATVE